MNRLQIKRDGKFKRVFYANGMQVSERIFNRAADQNSRLMYHRQRVIIRHFERKLIVV